MPAVTRTGAHAGPGVWREASIRPSLDTKPNSGGMPAIDRAATAIAVPVTGIRTWRPASSRRSRVPASWSTTPISMKSADLNSAWATVCTMAAVRATGVPMPMAVTSRPSWLIVE